LELKDRVVIVTGAAKGLGKTIAERCFVEGAKLALWDVAFEDVSSVAKTIDPGGKSVKAYKVDITDEKSVDEMMGKTVADFGKVDVLVNNAGISLHKPIDQMSLEIFERVMKVNVTGTFLCCRAVTPVMKAQKGGKIVNIASLAARTGRPGVGVNYAASKSAVVGITQTLARELGPSGIYVNCICPGPILTEQTKQYPAEVFASWNVGRAVLKDGLPEDVADAVVFLASEKSAWVTGVTLDVNGGIVIRG
jgi:NAD(P)-dependent dehydrogenase (short-subunit alcohol dehydrogenase family)